MIPVSLKLAPDMLRAAHSMAQDRDVTIGQMLRDLLLREMRTPKHLKTPNRADEALVASLQTLLARDIAQASGWEDLAIRTQGKGFELRPAGGGLALHRARCGTRLCKASELGFAYSKLVRRFGCGMPGHPHGYMPSGDPDVIETERT